MTYPQNPQGQPPSGQFPGQPYPGSQPTPAQPYPGMPPQPYGQSVGAYPGGPGMMQQKPSGGTAITAGVLAVIGGAWAIISVIIAISALSALPSGFHAPWQIYVGLGVSALNIGLLLYGGIGLFLHQQAGRICTIAGCAITIVAGILSVVTSGIAVSNTASSHGVRNAGGLIGMGIGFALVALIPPIATLVLSLVKPTAEWVNYRPNAVAGPQAGAYPPPQGW